MPMIKCSACGRESSSQARFCSGCGKPLATGQSAPMSKGSKVAVGCGIAVGIGIFLTAIIGLLAAIAIPSFVKARQTAQQNACINNLRMLDSAKEQWAMAENKQVGLPPDIHEVNQYIKGATTPICPQGGAYTYNNVGVDPECSHDGHRLSGY